MVKGRRAASVEEEAGALGDEEQESDAAAKDMAWKVFTPSVIDPAGCQARTWTLGLGGQCSLRTQAFSEFCTQHARNDTWKTHGKVDGPIPAAKLREFQRRRERAPLALEDGKPRRGSASAAQRSAGQQTKSEGRQPRSLGLKPRSQQASAAHAATSLVLKKRPAARQGAALAKAPAAEAASPAASKKRPAARQGEASEARLEPEGSEGEARPASPPRREKAASRQSTFRKPAAAIGETRRAPHREPTAGAAAAEESAPAVYSVPCCPDGHELVATTAYEIQGALGTCDRCQRIIPANDPVLECGECEWWQCPSSKECAKRQRLKKKVASSAVE